MSLPPRTYAEREEQRAYLHELVAERTPKLATATMVKRFYKRFPGARWAVRHLGTELDVDERTVRKAIAKLPSFGFELVDVHEESCVMPGDLPRRRYLRPLPRVFQDPSGRPPPDLDLLGTADPDLGNADQRATRHVDPDLSPDLLHKGQIGEISTLAGGSTRPRRRTHERARGARASRARPDRSRERPQTPAQRPARPVRRAAPVACEAGVWRALRQRYDGAWVSALGRELRFERYHERPVEADRALRTCLVRFPERPGSQGLIRMFRGFFKLAMQGYGLCDEAAWAQATVDAETAHLAADLPPDYDLPGLLERMRAEGAELDADRVHARASAEVQAWREEEPEECPLRRQLTEILAVLKGMSPAAPERARLQEDAVRLFRRGIQPFDEPTPEPAVPQRAPLTAEEAAQLSRDEPLARWTAEERAEWQRTRVTPA